jgi:thioredoxin-related protein
MSHFFFLLLFTFKIFSHQEKVSPYTKDASLAETLYAFEFEKMNTFGQFHSTDLKGSPALWVLFQPDCKSCEKQFKELTCLPSKVPVIAVGFWGSKERLAATARRFKTKSETVITGAEFSRLVALKQTPTILITDKNGIVKKKFLSLIPCKTIKQVLNSL